jgi:hypothetical protein
MAAVIEYPPSNTNNDNDDIQVLHERINTTPTNSVYKTNYLLIRRYQIFQLAN